MNTLRKGILNSLWVLLILGCDNPRKEYITINTERADTLKSDSLNIYPDEEGHTKCIINMVTNTKYIKEKICFLKSGAIDFSKSTFLEIRGNDLYYHSPYDKSYPIGKKRYVVFKGNNSIKKNFSNLKQLNLEELNFNQDGIIPNFRTKIPRIGIVEETVFLDTLIKSETGNKKIIRTIESYIDTDNLLFGNVVTKQ